MNILIATSEAVPFAKTGGLADVTTALAKTLQSRGHQVSLFLPYYAQIQTSGPAADFPVEATGHDVSVTLGPTQQTGRILKTSLPKSDVAVYLIDHPAYFDRRALYVENGIDYQDNSERFLFFSRAVIQAAEKLQLKPDIIHANDWQTGVIPALIKTKYYDSRAFAQTGTVFTIHNLAFQGQFWHWDMALTGLDWDYFNWQQMEFYGHLNLLKTGIVFSDFITTVSPSYAREIQTETYGAGLQTLLEHRSDRLVGILNGVDTSDWNPARDPHIAQQYDSETVDLGKATCKSDIQRQLRLPERENVPLLGMVTRMTDQKGFDILAGCVRRLLQEDLQLVILGTGDHNYETLLVQLSEEYPRKAAVTVGFDEGLAHQIEAGADIYLMPSKFEPCGLNQMYSLIYGTIPVVRAVGGLADSVVDASVHAAGERCPNGFSFKEYSAEDLQKTVLRALAAYRNDRQWKQMIQTGMTQDWSWERSANRYLEVYEQAIHVAEQCRYIPPAIDE